MKRFGHLYEKIVSFENIMRGAKKAMKGKRHKRAAATFSFRLENDVLRIHHDLVNQAYKPGPYDIFEIREPKVRKICSSVFRDRVVHHAICNVIEPIFERRLIDDTYACRKDLGVHAALERAQWFTQKYSHYLKCDIRKYFESVDHAVLKDLLRRVFKDPKLIQLLDQIINHTTPDSAPGKGIPIGNLTSQHFANLYLGELDHYAKEVLRVKGYLRYMDDFICFGDSKEELHEILLAIRRFVGDELKLALKEKVVRVAPVREGVPFLGFRIFPNMTRLQRTNLVRFRRRFKKKQRLYREGSISEAEMVKSVSSMIAHINYGNTTKLRRSILEKMA